LKVLHITHLYPRPYDPLLGIAMHNQIKTMEMQGCVQKVISPTPLTPFPIKHISSKWNSYSKVLSQDKIEGIEVYYPRYLVFPRAWLYASAGVRMYWGIKKLVKEIQLEFPFDLIHAHTALPDGHAGLLIAMEYKKPLIVTFQSTDLDITAKRTKRSLSILKRVFSNANCVIAPSPRLKKDFTSQFKIEPFFIGYGFDEKKIIIDNSNLPKSYEGRRILLSVSRLIVSKGIDINIRAIKKLSQKYKNLLYLIIGDGPERARLQELTRNLGLTNNVLFIGKLPYEQVMRYMAICEIFTLPSWQETFGLVYVEAMASAKPVIAVSGQGIDGIIIHGQNGFLVKPHDVDSLIEALDFLLSNPEKARIMGERARKEVMEHYTWEKIAEKTIALYRKVLNEG